MKTFVSILRALAVLGLNGLTAVILALGFWWVFGDLVGANVAGWVSLSLVLLSLFVLAR